VVTKEFAFFYNTVPDTGADRHKRRDLFHLVYQRTLGPQAGETLFGHAWSQDLLHWVVDTAAFAVDTTRWNSAHVWAPSLVEHGGKTYLFYAGVDQANDQSIGYASTSLLDTTDTVWDPDRVQVWTAKHTRWAVADPPIYGSQTQFRDPYVIPDPDSAGRLLMFYAAHDSVDFKLNRGGLAVGVARSEPGTVNAWKDLGYYPSTLRSVTNISQLEGPHVFPVNGGNGGWRLMFSSAGTPPGEIGNSTIRFENLAPGASVADTTRANWSAPLVLKDYLGGNSVVFGWSGSEQLHVSGGDYLAGFTAWGPVFQGIAITRMFWNTGGFSLGQPSLTAVDEYRSAARGVRMSLPAFSPRADVVTFELESPLELEAKLEVFDIMGRRVACCWSASSRRAARRSHGTWRTQSTSSRAASTSRGSRSRAARAPRAFRSPDSATGAGACRGSRRPLTCPVADRLRTSPGQAKFPAPRPLADPCFTRMPRARPSSSTSSRGLRTTSAHISPTSIPRASRGPGFRRVPARRRRRAALDARRPGIRLVHYDIGLTRHVRDHPFPATAALTAGRG
jgi:hypothetical protein